MADEAQLDLLSPVSDLGFVRLLLAEMHDELGDKVARFRQLADLSESLGRAGTMMPGGETVYSLWMEARSSFVHGNYIATVVLCQGLAEHLLAADLELGLNSPKLPNRISFKETLRRSVDAGTISGSDAEDFSKLMDFRNPLSHYRNLDDPSNLSRRALDARTSAGAHLRSDAGFAIRTAIKLLSLPSFRLDR